MHILVRRTAAVLAAPALSLTTLVATSAPAGATGSSPASASATWLERQLTDGLIHNDAYDFDDYGLSADVAMALVETGGHRSAVRQIRLAVGQHVDSWTTGADFGSSDVYAGSVAKAVVLAQSTGGDPTDFGGVDLVERLAGLISDEPGIAGRLQDETAGTDYSNTLGQAYAAAGLARAGSGAARPATRFLLQQQCAAGFFRLYFADPAAADQSCDGAARANRAPDTDATAVAVLNLLSIERPSRTVKKSITQALRWLVRHQNSNGSFGGGPTTARANSNSTGLAGWALARAGRCRAADNASDWVAALQKPNGAIAYDRAAFRAGIDGTSRDEWRRATSQAAPALALHGC